MDNKNSKAQNIFGYKNSKINNQYVNKSQEQLWFAGPKLSVVKLGEKWIAVSVPYYMKEWILFIKKIPGRTWNQHNKTWQLPLVKETVDMMTGYFKDGFRMHFNLPIDMPEQHIVAKRRKVDETKDNEWIVRALIAFKNHLMVLRRSPATIKSYTKLIKGLFKHYKFIKPSQISVQQIEEFILYRVKTDGIAPSTQNGLISSINSFYCDMLEQEEKKQKFNRPKKVRQVPNVFSEKEIELLIKGIENIKHKAMMVLIYSSGLRRSELLKLRITDLNENRENIFVKDSKGNKDRYTLLTPKAMKYVKQYMELYQPKFWLFEGQFGCQYSARSLQSVFQKAKEKSGVNPFVTLHGLRHSFATHLVERGVALHVVQQLLGHNNIKTTEIYLHTSNEYMRKVQSPLENLNI